MAEAGRLQALFFAPFVSSVMRIEPEWIDYNGHLNMAFYHVLLDTALGEALVLVGLSEDHARERNGSCFTAEVHVVYKRELPLGDPARVRVQLLGHDDKRLHLYMELCHATEGWISATCETMSLHVDLASRKVAPFPEDIAANLHAMRCSHARLPRPDTVGRSIRMPPFSESAAPAA